MDDAWANRLAFREIIRPYLRREPWLTGFIRTRPKPVVFEEMILQARQNFEVFAVGSNQEVLPDNFSWHWYHRLRRRHDDRILKTTLNEAELERLFIRAASSYGPTATERRNTAADAKNWR